MKDSQGRSHDLLLAVLVAALAFTDVAIREAYHRVSAEALAAVLLTFTLAVIAGTAVLGWASGWRGRAARISRLLFVTAGVLSLAASIGVSPATAWRGDGLARASLILVVSVAAILVLGAWRWTSGTWGRARTSVAAAVSLFIALPWGVGMVRSERMVWPPPSASSPSPSERSVTLVLLLDELNASAARPITDEIVRAGLQVRFLSVPSIGSSTTNVVPSVFAGAVFRNARACTPTTTCDRDRALDFARIRASRPDIDVVGFFQPYCAIEGLRSCYRATIPPAFLDAERIRCAIWRRTGWHAGTDAARCREVYLRSWGDMTAAVLDATRNARALREGGMLFAHVPLPHPPGEDVSGSLQDHYRANLSRAATLVGGLLRSARESGLESRVLIFSDHPLRQEQWCRSFAPYVMDRCHPEQELHDSLVPVIVAGKQPPDLGGMRDNLDVFGLVDRLR